MNSFRYAYRATSVGVAAIAGLALASQATSLIEFQLIYGVVVGAAAGAGFAPTMATVTGWFVTHRGKRWLERRL